MSLLKPLEVFDNYNTVLCDENGRLILNADTMESVIYFIKKISPEGVVIEIRPRDNV